MRNRKHHKPKPKSSNDKATDKQIKYIFDLSDRYPEAFDTLPTVMDKIGVHNISDLTVKEASQIIRGLLKALEEPVL